MLSPSAESVRLFLHVIAAAVWVGGQIALAGIVPALRRDHPTATSTVAKAFARVAWPAFAVGWVLIFFGIMRELSASILLYSVGSEVLSVVLLKLWANGQAEQVSVIGLMMMLLVIFFRWVQLKLIKQRISTL